MPMQRPQAASASDCGDLGRPVNVVPEGAPDEAPPLILDASRESCPPGIPGIAEGERPPRLAGGRANERRHVRVAAHDAVHHDDICRLDGLRILGDVPEPPLDALGEPKLAQELLRELLVCRRELDVGRSVGAPPQ